MRVVIAGGTGFLGRALSAALLQQGHEVVLLTRAARRPGAAQAGGPGAGGGPGAALRRVAWVPDGTAGEWGEAVDGADAVVNLAGESIAAGRWTDERRRAIRDSRVFATRSLVEAIRSARRPPPALVSGSGQGYYGDRGDEILTEESAPGSDFLAGVCQEWETEARAASTVARVVLLRTALVLDREEGALPRMIQPFKLFAGGPVGSGRQFVSWVHHEDWVRLAVLAMTDERFVGAVNVGSPNPVTNAEFGRAIGKALGRPSWVRTPAIALRAALGEMAETLLLASQRMVPARALEHGYRFLHPEVAPALKGILG
ncbi:MAG TPA: TIGR01777 family oxidoreductase [Vicinamibacterales bacterium]|nr:TIGR01777 family oxidoreductase [Vicinamibacterales bacterium]